MVSPDHDRIEHGENDNILERIGDAMLLEEAQQVGRVLVYDDVCAGNVDAEAIGGEVLAILRRSVSATAQ